jgi:hypothetical protein
MDAKTMWWITALVAQAGGFCVMFRWPSQWTLLRVVVFFVVLMAIAFPLSYVAHRRGWGAPGSASARLQADAPQGSSVSSTGP